MSDRNQGLFAGLRAPGPSPELKRRALAAAREAATSPARSLTNRMWGSRPLHLAWVGVAICLLAINLHLGLPGPLPSPEPVTLAESTVVDDVDLLDLLPERRPSRPTLAETRQLLDELLDEGPSSSTTTNTGEHA